MLELTVAVLAVVFQSQVKAWLNDFFLANIKAYRDDIDLQNLIDSLQRMVTDLTNCCSTRLLARCIVTVLMLRLCVLSPHRTTAAAHKTPQTGTRTSILAATRGTAAERSVASRSPAASTTQP